MITLRWYSNRQPTKEEINQLPSGDYELFFNDKKVELKDRTTFYRIEIQGWWLTLFHTHDDKPMYII